MRVAIDARLIGGTSTGDSTYWTALAPALLAADPSLELVLISDRPIPEVPGTERAERIVGRRRGRVFSLVELPRLARRAGADLVHLQYAIGFGFASPVVSTVHDVSFLIGPEWFSARDRWLLRCGVFSAARRAARLITVSETSRREIERLVPGAAGKTDVALNACPPWIVRREPSEARARLGIAEPFVLTVGARWARKDMELAIAAMDSLSDDLPHRLLVTGRGGGDASLGRRGVATGYVDADTLSDLYSAADLYLAPSRHEGFGLPILEAFRCGCPVLTTGAGAMVEVAGGAAEIASAAEWPTVLEALLRDGPRRARLREAGIAREGEFRWADAARATLACYRRAVQP